LSFLATHSTGYFSFGTISLIGLKKSEGSEMMDDVFQISSSLTFSEGVGLLSVKPLLFEISLEVCRFV
jgi:hypothetical protein